VIKGLMDCKKEKGRGSALSRKEGKDRCAGMTGEELR